MWSIFFLFPLRKLFWDFVIWTYVIQFWLQDLGFNNDLSVYLFIPSSFHVMYQNNKEECFMKFPNTEKLAKRLRHSRVF